MKRVFIDGAQGSVGLEIGKRLEQREDIVLVAPPEEGRKDPAARKDLINSSDIVFLCLPDGAARESAALCESESVKLIDASTAHRTAPGWTYGFPELGFREELAASRRVCVPGCHAGGACAILAPLVRSGAIGKDCPVSVFSVTGYTGGGKKMIEEYEGAGRPADCDSPRQYALGQTHKHLPEIGLVCGLELPPVFLPVVGDFPRGMAVSVPLHRSFLKREFSVPAIFGLFSDFYAGEPVISVKTAEEAVEGGFLAANALAGKDSMEIIVCGNGDRINLVARFDNLGKGACGAALQCMNILAGLDEESGLVL